LDLDRLEQSFYNIVAHGSRIQELFSLALIKFDIKLISHKLNGCQPTTVSFEPN